MRTAKISRSSKTYIKSRYVFCSEERLPKLDSRQPPVSLHEEMFLRRWQAPRSIRMGPETLAGAESQCGRLSEFFGSQMKQYIVNSSRFYFVPKSLPHTDT